MAKTPSAAPGAREPVLVDLAFQGGGSHGAFTWGVVDRLLEEDWLEIEGISGTSAGAMNAAVLASGLPRAAPPGRGRRSRPSGSASPTPPTSAPSSAARWTSCWAAGRSTTRRST